MITDNKLIKYILNDISAEDFSVAEHKNSGILALNMDNMMDKKVEESFPHLKKILIKYYRLILNILI